MVKIVGEVPAGQCKAEHPEKMIKQVILDMQNQLLQVKTQVAIAIADQHLLEKRQKEVENLKTALRQLQQKLAEAEAKAKADLLIAQHRRARAASKASDAEQAAANGSSANAFDRMKRKVAHAAAHSQAKSEIVADDVEERLAALEKKTA